MNDFLLIPRHPGTRTTRCASWTSTPGARADRAAGPAAGRHAPPAGEDRADDRPHHGAERSRLRRRLFQVGRDRLRRRHGDPRRYGLDQTVGETLGPGGVYGGYPDTLDEGLGRDHPGHAAACPRRAAAQLRQPHGGQLLVRGRPGPPGDQCHSVQHRGRAGVDHRGWRTAPGPSAPPGSTTRRGCWKLRHHGRDVMAELRTAVNRTTAVNARRCASWTSGTPGGHESVGRRA